MASNDADGASCQWTPGELQAGTCAPCASCKDSPPLTREQALQQMPSLCPSWTISEKTGDEGQILMIERSFVTKNFVAAMDFLNKAAVIAEEQGHHPDFHITSYRNVSVVLYTHNILGFCAFVHALCGREESVRACVRACLRACMSERSVQSIRACAGLHKNDFVLAAKFDTIPITYSPKFLKENPQITAGLV